MNNFSTNAFYAFFRLVLGSLFSLLVIITIARIYGPGGQGIYALIVLLPNLLFTVLNLGLPVSTIHFSSKKEHFPEDILATSLVATAVLSVLGLFLGFFIIQFFSEFMFKGIKESHLNFVVFSIPFIFFSFILQCLYQGIGKFKLFFYSNLIQYFTLLVLIWLFFLFGLKGIKFLVVSFVLSHVVSAILSLYLLPKTHLKIKLGQFRLDFLKSMASYGLKNHLGLVLNFLNYRLDIFFVSYYTSVYDVGIYTGAVNGAERLWLLSHGISAVLFPRISGMEEEEQRNILTSRIARNVFLISCIGGIFFYFFGEQLIVLLLGNEFRASFEPLMILIPGIVMTCHSRILSNDIAARGRPEINSYFAIYVVVLNILLNILLIPHFGIAGAALATTVTYFSQAWGMIYVFKRLTKIKMRKLFVLESDDKEFYISMVKKYFWLPLTGWR